MQRGNGGRDDVFGGFGSPFGGLGDPFNGFGGFGRPGGIISSVFGGRDPFDDPFFTRPFGSMLGPSMFGPSLLGPSGNPFGLGPSFLGPSGNPFGPAESTGFIVDRTPQPNKSRGPVIRELNSDEEEEGEEADVGASEKKENGRKHSRSGKEPYVQDPDENVEEKKSRYMQYQSNYGNTRAARPQTHAFSFQSSSVTYGGPNGAYYTSSTTRRTGGDGVTLEESKEADTTTGRASHRLTKGLRAKGHTLTRNLNSDGRVDTMQTLHNLNEDELAGFDEVWKGNARQHLPGWNHGIELLGDRNRSGSTGQERQQGWALPSIERQQGQGRMESRGAGRANPPAREHY